MNLKRLAAIVFLFVSCVAMAQKTATVTGTIVDSDNTPYDDANITVQGYLSYSATTNAAGKFTITIPADTLITLKISHVGFGIKYKTVKVKAGESQKLKLIFDDSFFIDTVDIIDNSNRDVFMQKIPIKDIYVQTGPSGDFNVILFSQPGVMSSNELSSGYSVRGGNFDENLVYVNDVEVYRPFLVRSGQQEGLSFVNPDMVQEVQFSTGGFEAKYGDKMSSVLDIKYRKPTKFGGSAAASLLGGSIHLEGCTDNKRFTWIVGARQKSNQYILKSLDTQGDYRPFFYDVQSYLTFDITDEWEISLLTNLSRNKYVLVPESRQSDFGTVNQALRLSVFFEGQEIDQYRTYLGALTLSNRPSKKNLQLKYIFSAYHANETETFDLLGEYRLDQLENDLGKDNFGQVAFNLGTGGFLQHARNYLSSTVYNAEHKGNKMIENDTSFFTSTTYFDWGIKYQHEEIKNNLSEWKMTDSAGYSTPLGNPDVLELEELIKTKINIGSNRYSGYVQYNLKKKLRDTSEISLNIGARANYWDLNRQFLAGPRAVFYYRPNWKRDFAFKAATGYYYQPPFYRELTDLYGNVNTNLKAQTSIHFVMGSDFNFKAYNRDFKFTSEIYYKQLKNLIPYEIDNVRIRYYAKNMAKGYVTGVDMKIAGEIVKGVDSWVSLSVLSAKEDILNDSYTLNYNQNGDLIIPGYTTDDSVATSITKQPGYVPRPTDQRVNVAIFFQDYLPKLPRCQVHLNLLFGSGLPFGPPTYERYKDTLRMPPYRRVDIGFSYELLSDSMKTKKFWGKFQSIWIRAEVYNLLAINNTVSYLWVQDVADRTYAIPNYLSRRLLNLRMIVRF
jgi:hypothetical protein